MTANLHCGQIIGMDTEMIQFIANQTSDSYILTRIAVAVLIPSDVGDVKCRIHDYA